MNLPRPMKAEDGTQSWAAAGGDIYSNHVIEPKVDGVRAFLQVEDGRTKVIVATSHRVIEHDLPQMYGLERKFDSLLLDGELVIPGGTLGTIVGALNATKRRAILDKAVFYAFDILSFQGKGGDRNVIYDHGLTRRRQALEMVADVFPTGVRLMAQYEFGEPVIDAIKRAGFEGFMLKHPNSGYEPKRSKWWQKVKWTSTIDCFVIGWDPGHGGYEGLVGSLTMGVYDEHGQVVEVGKHGVFSEHMRTRLTDPNGGLNPWWLEKVMEVTYQSVGTDLRMRHPRLLRVRPDKSPNECTLAQLRENL